MDINRLIIVKRDAVNRQQKREFKKELEEIKKEILPIFYAFKNVYKNPTEYDLELAEPVFKRTAHAVNKNKKYILVNLDSFRSTFKTEEEEQFYGKIEKRNKIFALVIFALLLAIILLAILQ